MACVLVPLADGCEEIETTIIIDVLRRAKWEVTAAGLNEGIITASRGVKIVPDTTIEAIDINSFDLIVLPGGGPGTDTLMADERIVNAIKDYHEKDKTVAEGHPRFRVIAYDFGIKYNILR